MVSTWVIWGINRNTSEYIPITYVTSQAMLLSIALHRGCLGRSTTNAAVCLYADGLGLSLRVETQKSIFVFKQQSRGKLKVSLGDCWELARHQGAHGQNQIQKKH